MALGRAVRSLGLATTIGRVRETPSRDGLKRGTLSPRGECQSMCAFVVLGGVRRVVPAESRVLVHQIWLGDRRDDATAAQYTAEDLVLVQRDIGQLVQYTAETGGGSELIELALRIPPWEPMRALSRDELRRTRLDTGPDRGGRESAGNVSGAVAIAAGGGLGADPNERGWTLTERAGRAVLVRQHPLTIEGERIGAFEVALACGATADSFDVTYAVTRGNVDDPTATLRQVEMWVEGQSSSLEIMTSQLKSGARELRTLAAGELSAAAMRSFADAALDALTVRTASSINPATVIRVGSSGFAQSFSRLEAACGGQQTRANTHARLDPVHAESAGSVR